MPDFSGFIGDGIKAVRDALDTAAARVNLHLHPDTLTRAAARRLKRTLGVLETVLRRLLVLMAAEIELAPLAPRTPSAAKRPDAATTPPQPARRGFALMPVLRYDAVRLEDLKDRARPRHQGAANATPLRHRCDTLRRLLENPYPAAKRMARLLARLKRAGAAKPVVLPQTGLSRLKPDLALTASILPERVGDALAGWYDTS